MSYTSARTKNGRETTKSRFSPFLLFTDFRTDLSIEAPPFIEPFFYKRKFSQLPFLLFVLLYSEYLE